MQLDSDPCLGGTQTFLGLAKIGHLMTYALMNDIKHSIIGYTSPY